jgi:hypothetical protein
MALPQLPPDRSDWALLLGPGEELERLAPLLEALESTHGVEQPLGIDVLDDLGQLFSELPERGRLVLHAAWLPLEDLGLVRRFLDASPGWELVLVGLDPGASAPRRLLRLPGTRWFSDPLDLDQLDELLNAPDLRIVVEDGFDEDEAEDDEDYDDVDPLSAALGVELDEDELAAFRDEALDGDWSFDEADADEDAEELEELAHETEAAQQADSEPESAPSADFDEEIERILAVPPQSSAETDSPGVSSPATATALGEQRTAAAAPLPRSAPNDPFGALLRDVAAHEDAPVEAPQDLTADSIETAQPPHGSAPGSPATPSPQAPAPYFKHQVADLVDIALRIELSLEMARERALLEDDAPALDELELEIQRLLQFTRTLGYLSSPPAAGRTRIALGQMVEEMLAEAGNDDHSPRYLWRSDGLLHVRCDKTLMHHALEAVLYLVHHCAGSAGTVRVEGRESNADGKPAGEVELSLRFPPGPLSGLEPATAVVPYALRTMLPDLGPNALAAATGILRGQGGDLSLSTAGPEWVWRLRLPRA